MQLPFLLVPFAAEPVLPRNPAAADEAVEPILQAVLPPNPSAADLARLPEAVVLSRNPVRADLAGIPEAVELVLVAFLPLQQAMQLMMIYVGGKSTPRPAIPPRPST